MIRTVKASAYLTPKTEAVALHWLDLCRYLYNNCLEQRITAYKHNGVSVSAYDQMKELPAIKKEFPEFAEVGSQVLQDVTLRIDKAFKNFFRHNKAGKKGGFPRFKGKNRYNSFTLTQAGWKLIGDKLHITNLGILHLTFSQPIQGDIKTVTVKHESTGKWSVLFTCDNVPPKAYPETNKAIGIDVGINPFLHDTNNTKIENPKHMKTSLEVLQERQRKLSKKQNGSNRREKSRKQVAKVHEKIKNQREDFLHKVSHQYVKENQLIAVEDLQVQKMVENDTKNLTGYILDCSWSKLFEMISYKAEEAGRVFIKVDPKNTTQMCSNCGQIVTKDLSVKVHDCPYCGCVLDRNYNAALNILSRGLAQVDPVFRASLELPDKWVGQTPREAQPVVSESPVRTEDARRFLCKGKRSCTKKTS